MVLHVTVSACFLSMLVMWVSDFKVFWVKLLFIPVVSEQQINSEHIMRDCLWCKWFGSESCWLARWTLRQQHPFQMVVKDPFLSARSLPLSLPLCWNISVEARPAWLLCQQMSLLIMMASLFPNKSVLALLALTGFYWWIGLQWPLFC